MLLPPLLPLLQCACVSQRRPSRRCTRMAGIYSRWAWAWGRRGAGGSAAGKEEDGEEDGGEEVGADADG